MTKKAIGLIAVLIFVIGLGLTLVYRDRPAEILPERSSIRLGYLSLPQPVFIAAEKGFFAEEDLEVSLIKFENANVNLEAMARGDVDGSGAIAYLTLFAFENNAPGALTVFFSAEENEHTPWSQLIVKENGKINSVEDLPGKTIVMRAGLSSKIQAEAVLKGMGIDPDQVTFLQVQPNLLVQTFASQQVDAFLDIQPHATILIKKGLGKPLVNHPRSTYIQNPYPLAAGVLNRKFVQDNPDAVRRFVRAITRAIAFSRENAAETRTIYQKYLNLDSEIIADMPFFESFPIKEVNIAQVARLAEWSVAQGLLDKNPDLSNFFYNDIR